MTDTDDGGSYPDGWARDEIARITAQISAEAKCIKGEVLGAISGALTNRGLDGGLDGIPALSGVIWKTVRDKLIEKTLDGLIKPQEGRESQPRAGDTRSGDRFEWRYDRHRRRLSVWGRNFQRDLVTIRSMVEEGNIPRPDAIIYQSGRSATVLRGRKLDRWMSDTTRI
jgi:hypothetical protein